MSFCVATFYCVRVCNLVSLCTHAVIVSVVMITCLIKGKYFIHYGYMYNKSLVIVSVNSIIC